MLAEIVQGHLLGDGRNLVEPHLAPQALDVELLGVAIAAEGLEGRVARLEARLGGEELGRVGLPAARAPRVEEPRRLEAHQLRRIELGQSQGERMGDRLILADGAVEDHALLGVLGGALEGRAPDSHRLDAHHDALGIEGVDEVVEAVAHRAHHVRLGHLEVVDEDLVRVHGGPPELLDLAHRDGLAVELGEEERHALEGLGGVAVARAREEEPGGGAAGGLQVGRFAPGQRGHEIAPAVEIGILGSSRRLSSSVP